MNNEIPAEFKALDNLATATPDAAETFPPPYEHLKRPIDSLTGVRCSCLKPPFLFHEEACDVSKAWPAARLAATREGLRRLLLLTARMVDWFDSRVDLAAYLDRWGELAGEERFGPEEGPEYFWRSALAELIPTLDPAVRSVLPPE